MKSTFILDADLRALEVAVREVVVPLSTDQSESGLASDLQQVLNFQWIQGLAVIDRMPRMEVPGSLHWAAVPV